MKNLRLYLFLAIFSLISFSGFSKKLRVLFIGNSYTYTNNLPDIISKLATSQGDTLIFDSNLPGGFTLSGHFTNSVTRQKIAQGGWDFVVFQAQSQEPAFPENQVATNTLPFARKLDSLVNAVNSCTETQFFMTWGRKNGDASNCANFPPICTYQGMQDLLSQRYLQMAKEANGSVSPVGEAWRKSIALKPNLDLYSPDLSHPALTGSYLSALVFYKTLFRKNFLNPVFKPVGIEDSTANFFKNIAQNIVEDSAGKWFEKSTLTRANFDFEAAQNVVGFRNKSYGGNQFRWSFGNGNFSVALSPTQTYANAGTYSVKLVSRNNCKSDSATKNLIILPFTQVEGLVQPKISVFPNPGFCTLNIQGEYKELFIIDFSGKRVFETHETKKEINVSHLPLGHYKIQIRDKWNKLHSINWWRKNED